VAGNRRLRVLPACLYQIMSVPSSAIVPKHSRVDGAADSKSEVILPSNRSDSCSLLSGQFSITQLMWRVTASCDRVRTSVHTVATRSNGPSTFVKRFLPVRSSRASRLIPSNHPNTVGDPNSLGRNMSSPPFPSVAPPGLAVSHDRRVTTGEPQHARL